MKRGQQTDRQTDRQTFRLLDRSGPEGRFGENLTLLSYFDFILINLFGKPVISSVMLEGGGEGYWDHLGECTTELPPLRVKYDALQCIAVQYLTGVTFCHQCYIHLKSRQVLKSGLASIRLFGVPKAKEPKFQPSINFSRRGPRCWERLMGRRKSEESIKAVKWSERIN